MKRSPRIVVVGSVNIDMVVRGERLPARGETVTGGRFVMAAGGKGANQAVAAARLGADVTLVASVGDDMFGRQSIANFERERIDIRFLSIDPEHATGVALILVDERGDNVISVAPGANLAVTAADIARAGDRIRSADLLMVQLEIPAEAVEAAVDLAAGCGVPVMLNPAPARPLDPSLLRRVTYLTPNESEAERLTGNRVHDEASAREAATRLVEAGSRHVVVTMGAAGALLVDADGARRIASRAVRAVDTTAAGDAFCGGLGCAVANGVPLEQAVRDACLVGALSTTRLGAQPSLPTRAELERFAAG
jgi:ribokinase